jgi:general secretion pathway protein G
MCIHSIRKYRLKRRADSGLSLMEMLAVLTIMGLVVGLVAPRVMGHVGTARVKAARAQVELLAGALESWRLDMGRYPTEKEGLAALVTPPETDRALWRGPYLNKRSLPKDPWGKDFGYAIPARRGGVDFDVFSNGADGMPGGEGDNADIGNW